jgi:DNA-binding protein H-NS
MPAISSSMLRAQLKRTEAGEKRTGGLLSCTSKLAMKNIDLNAKSIEELWALHEEIASILSAKMETEKLKLEKRLEQIEAKTSDGAPRRQYPKVYPRFRNPDPPHQTWSGRGLQPHWMRKLLAEGKTVDDLRILPSPIADREN